MSLSVISLLGLLISLALLIIMSYKGFPIVFVAILCSVIIFILEGALNPEAPGVVEAMKTTFMTGFVGFAKNYFLLLLFSTIFAMLMAESGAADSIAEAVVKMVGRFPGKEKYAAVFSMTIIGAILTAGGVSPFIIVFVCMPIAKALFMQLNCPWHLFMCYVLGTGCFTLSSLPGMPALNNIIPTQYLGTTPTAAPTIGIVATITMIIAGSIYNIYAVKKTILAGEGFFPTGEGINEVQLQKETFNMQVQPWMALVPPVVVILTLNVLKQSAELSMVVGCVVCYLMFFKNLTQVITGTVARGAGNAANVVIVTSTIVGFGSAASSTLGYTMVVDWLNGLEVSPVWKIVITVNILAGLLGSASAGLTVAMDQLSPGWIESGLSPDVIHRIAAISSSGLDTLPHNASIVVGLQVVKMTHKQGYKHLFAQNCVVPLIGNVVAAIVATMGVI